MKIAVITGAVVALAAGAIATPTFAQDPCHSHQQSRTTTGAVVGGLAGALLGSQLAGHHNQGQGALIGGVAGAVIGGAVGRSSAKCDGYYGYNQPYSNAGYYAAPPYNGYDTGQYGYGRGYAPRYYNTRYNNGYYGGGYSDGYGNYPY
jgi:hypothetical protein